MPEWKKLPKEVQLQILEHVAEGHDRPPRPLGRGAYASVCKDWQAFFEPFTFRRLVLGPSHLPEFRDIVAGQRSIPRLTYLTQLYFIINLSTYDCFECDTDQSQSTIVNDNATFTNSVIDLLNILREWTVRRWEELRRNNPDVHGLQKLSELDLYIGASSLSDCEHFVNDFRLHEDYSFWFKSEVDYRAMHNEYLASNPVQATVNHWVPHGQLFNLQNVGSGVWPAPRQRLTGSRPLRLNYRDHMNFGRETSTSFLSEVEKITGLFLPRHFLRDIGGYVLSCLVTSCPRLKRLTYGRWTEEKTRYPGNRYVTEFCNFLQRSMPGSLEVLNLFEDYNRTFPFGKTAAAGSRYRPFHLEHELGQALLAGSKNLRELTACFIVDAAEFFHRFFERSIDARPEVFEAEHPWSRLERLTLTAEVLSETDTRNVQIIHDLLFAAGTAAGLMPKLELMEIWDSAWNVARVFRYEVVDDHMASVTWLSNLTEPGLTEPGFIHQLPGVVFHLWQQVAGNRELTWNQIQLHFPEPDEDDADTWIRYLDVVPHLRSRDRVLLPLSRVQVQLESETDLVNDTPRSTLVDPLTWEEVSVTPRNLNHVPQYVPQAWCWHPLSSHARTPVLRWNAGGSKDDNGLTRWAARRDGDPRMLHD